MRLRFAAVPIAILVCSLRRWRPLPLAVLALALAAMWNVSPLVYSFTRSSNDPSAAARLLGAGGRLPAPLAVARLPRRGRRHRRPLGGRLPAAGRRSRSSAAGSARTTSRRTRCSTTSSPGAPTWPGCGISASATSCSRTRPADYSAKAEIALLRSGRSGLPVVFRSPDFTIYAVPSPQPIVTGPGHPTGREGDRVDDHARARRSPAATSSGSATRPTSPRRRPASARRRTG